MELPLLLLFNSDRVTLSDVNKTTKFKTKTNELKTKHHKTETKSHKTKTENNKIKTNKTQDQDHIVTKKP